MAIKYIQNNNPYSDRNVCTLSGFLTVASQATQFWRCPAFGPDSPYISAAGPKLHKTARFVPALPGRQFTVDMPPLNYLFLADVHRAFVAR